jgi:Predicted acyltransferases
MAALEALEVAELSTAERKVSTGVDGASRLPVLDGVRAVAISLVIIHHALFVFQFSLMLGHLGVSIFFVLSGFLITRVMLADEERHGRLRIGRFYRRRALRILPAFYFFLAAVWLLSALGGIAKPAPLEWISSIFYFRNFVEGHWATGHIWSLSLEEQFYFLWPMLFVITRKFRVPLILSAAIAFTAYRGYWLYTHPVSWEIYIEPQFRLDTFLIGGAFAISRPAWTRNLNGAFVLAAILLWFPLSYYPLTQTISTPVTAALIGALICKLADTPADPLTAALSRRAPVLIGEFSYSLYLWQQLFLGERLHWWALPALVMTAACSYLLIERPFLRLKDRRQLPDEAVV